MASLTKIMTCYIAVKFIENNKLSLSTSVKINKQAERIGGTSANLKYGDII